MNSFTIWSAPTAFLFSSLATHAFASSLVNSLCNPAEALSSLSDASKFASAHALILFGGGGEVVENQAEGLFVHV